MHDIWCSPLFHIVSSRKGGISDISVIAQSEVTLSNSSTVRGQDEPAGVTAMEVQGKSEGCYITK